MITIILLVSRDTFLNKVINTLELLDCDHENTNILAIVDGRDELYVRVRNLIADMNYKERLTVRAKLEDEPPKIDINARRRRIAAIHNQAKTYIKENNYDYVFLCEDDTTFPADTLKKLIHFAAGRRSLGMIEGVELGRWGTPYVGAWRADDLYETKVIKSVENKYSLINQSKPEPIDAGGFYCALVPSELYRNSDFFSTNGLGPDVNFGISIRQKGYENFIDWSIPCTHWYTEMGSEKKIEPTAHSDVVTMTQKNSSSWKASSLT